MNPHLNLANHTSPVLSGEVHNGTPSWIGTFQAMASDCQILIEGATKQHAHNLLTLATKEAWRIEQKYSRYRDDNIMTKINTPNGCDLEVDFETSALLNFAEQCYQLSDGLYDITIGTLRRVWNFDGSDQVPTSLQVQEVLQDVGWQRIQWASPRLILPQNMELDFGGFGKEYAVDKVTQILKMACRGLGEISLLVNFGGDLACSGPRLNGQAWKIAVESSKKEHAVAAYVQLSQGAIATSGDARRYLLKDNIRYSHILNPKTGQSVIDAPRAVSVAGSSCMQAGMISTLALLQGKNAESFLKAQDIQHWIQD